MSLWHFGRRQMTKKRRRSPSQSRAPSGRSFAFESLEARELLAADVSITEAGSPDPVAVNQNETYTLTVTNNDSTNTANNVVVHDTLPSGANFVSGSTNPPGGNVSVSFNTVTAAIGDLAPNTTATVTIVLTYGSTGIKTNTATVSSDTSDSNQNNNTASATTTVGAAGGAADLSISKSGSPNPVAVGQDETYTLTVTNHDPANSANGVVATDTLAPGTNVVSMSTSASGGSVTLSGGKVTADLGTLAAGTSETVTIVATFSQTGSKTDTATVGSTTTDNNQNNNTASFTTLVNSGTGTPTADLSLTETGSPDTIDVNQEETYTLTVTNNSTSTTSNNVVIHDTLTNDATLKSSSTTASGGSVTQSLNTITANLGNLAPGATVTVTLVVNYNAAGLKTNTATVTSSTSDDNQDNNQASVTTPVGASGGAADLSIAVAGSPDSVNVGQQETYTLTVTNNDPVNASSNVTVTDNLPAGAAVVSASTDAPGGSVSTSNGKVTASLGDLAAGASDTVTVVVTFNQTGSKTNSVTVGSPTQDNNPNNNSASVTTVVNNNTGTPAADISLTETGSPNPVGLNQDETYTLTVTNNDSSTTATGVVVHDTISKNATYVSGSTTATGGNVTQSLNAITANLGDIAPGDSVTVTIIVRYGSVGDESNSATVNSATSDGDQSNNSSSVSTTVSKGTGPSSPDLSIAKTGSPNPVGINQEETYTLTVTNNDPVNAATGVVVTDTLPPDAQVVSTSTSASGATVTVSNGKVIASLGQMAGGDVETVTIGVTFTAVGQATDTATVTSTSTDSDPSNNSASFTTTINNGAGTPVADLSLSGTGSPDPVAVGQQETYTLTVTNNDNATTAHNVVVRDTFSNNATYVSGSTTAAGGTINQSLNTVTADLGDLAPGASATVTLIVTYNSAGTETNTALASSSTSDDDHSNNTANITTTVGATGGAADLSIEKSGSPEPVRVGQQETYTLTVTNHASASAASGVVVTDDLPAGATVVSTSTSASGGSVTVSGNKVTASLGSLAAGASDSVTIIVTFAAAGSATDTATVSSVTADPNSSNNTASFTTAVLAATGHPDNLSITQTASPQPDTVGQQLIYQFTISNSSGVDAANVTVSDTLPSDATFSSSAASQGSTLHSGGSVTALLGTLPAGHSATVTIVVTPTASGPLTNSATLTASMPNGNVDTTSSNTTQILPASASQAGLSISQTATPDPGSVGQPLTYTIDVVNSGAATASQVVLSDPLPAGVQFVSASSSTGSAALSGNTVTANLGDLAAGASARITLVVQPGQGGALLNTASVTSPDVNGGAPVSGSITSIVNDTGGSGGGGGAGGGGGDGGGGGASGHVCYLAGQAGDGSAATFVQNLYRELLGRAPDPQGQAAWLSRLQQGGNSAGSRASVVQAFLSSPEYLRHWVSCVYENFLNRAPDAAGLQYWVQQLNRPAAPGAGIDEQAVVAAILGSSEYLGLNGGTAQGWIGGLYQDVLGRAADPGGSAYWIQQASQQGVQRNQLALAFLDSPEALHKLLNADYPVSQSSSSLPTTGAPASGAYAMAELTGGGWENLFFRQSSGQVNDQYFAELGAQTSWDSVIEEMLASRLYFNANLGS